MLKHPSFDGFVEWLRTKDPNEHYDYCDPHNCVLAQYGKFCYPYEHVLCGVPAGFNIFSGQHLENVHVVLPNEDIICNSPWTFGACLERAEAAL
jgi:hypothetical protein